MEIERLTRDDIARLFESPALTKDQIIAVALEELAIKISPDLSKEEMVDAAFNAYNLALVDVASHYAQVKAEKATNTRRSKTDGKLSRKQFIINLIGKGGHNKESLLKVVGEEYGYTAKGRTAKTRVSKVLRALRQQNLLEESADGTFNLKGSK